MIKKGLVDAKLVENISSDGNNTDKYYKVEFTFKDGTKKILEVTAQYARDFDVCTGSLSTSEEAACKYDKDDFLKIGYGSAPGADDYVSYDLPDLGYGYNGNIYASEYGRQCSGNYDKNGVELDETKKQGCKVYDFRISNVIIETEEIFNFYVGFYHPDFETRYGIDIIYPITLSIEQSALDLGPICGTQTPERVDWDNTSEVTISVECVAREGGRPCTQSHFSETFTTDSKINYITISSDDGNETRCPVTAYIDKTKPTTPTVVSTEGFPSGTWKNSQFTLKVTSSDRHSGIAYYQYCYPGADNVCGEGEWITYEESKRSKVEPGEFTYETTPFSIERSEKVFIRAVDVANNKSDPGEFIINIDRTAPVVSNINFDSSTRNLTATITDNLSKVSKYIISESSSSPSNYNDITDVVTYNLSEHIDDSISGTYYIWVQDALGNEGKYSVYIDPVVVNVNILGSYHCANTYNGSEPYEMTYTGNCAVVDDGGGNWRVKFLTTGDLKFISNVDIDVFLVGGGGGGNASHEGVGGGGGGGKTITNSTSIVANQLYKLTIGSGGSGGIWGSESNTPAERGGKTMGFSFTADGGRGGSPGNGGSGGSGGGAGGWGNGSEGSKGLSGGYNGKNGTSGSKEWQTGGTGQRTTTREFGETSGTLYAGGGGGGRGCDNDGCTTPGSGGAGGAGSGGDSEEGENGIPNTGGGGGGGGARRRTGGSGGSGIIVIRNKR